MGGGKEKKRGGGSKDKGIKVKVLERRYNRENIRDYSS